MKVAPWLAWTFYVSCIAIGLLLITPPIIFGALLLNASIFVTNPSALWALGFMAFLGVIALASGVRGMLRLRSNARKTTSEGVFD